MSNDPAEVKELAGTNAALAELWQARNFREGAILATEATRRWPEVPRFCVLHAQFLLSAGALIEAEAAARQYLSEGHDALQQEKLWLVLTDALIRQERAEDARNALREACFACPSSVALQGCRGHQATQAKDNAEVVDAYEIACSLTPDNEALQFGLLSSLWQLKRYAVGSSAAARAVDQMPGSSLLRQQHASFLLAEGRSVKAAEAARRAIALDPGNANAHWALTNALWQHDCFGEAFCTLEAATDAVPGSQLLLHELARISVSMGRLDAVIRVYRRAVNMPDMPAEIWHTFIRTLIDDDYLQGAGHTVCRDKSTLLQQSIGVCKPWVHRNQSFGRCEFAFLAKMGFDRSPRSYPSAPGRLGCLVSNIPAA